jgi:hypothetical protein
MTMTKEKKKRFELRCPHCHEDNKIDVSKSLHCNSCKKTLMNSRYIKPLVKGGSIFVTAILMGIGTGVVIDEPFESDRYPIDVEYSIIERTLSSDNTPVSRKRYQQKKEICIEALEETQKDFDYAEFKESPIAFMNEYEKQVRQAAR